MTPVTGSGHSGAFLLGITSACQSPRDLFIPTLQPAELTCLPQARAGTRPSLRPGGSGAISGLLGPGLSAEWESWKMGSLDIGEAHVSGGAENVPRDGKEAGGRSAGTGQLVTCQRNAKQQVCRSQEGAADVQSLCCPFLFHPTLHRHLSAQGRPVNITK